MERAREVVVVGGGIAGCAVAYELARRGLRVTLVEQGTIAGRASSQNMGLLLNQVEAPIVRARQHSLDIYLTLSRASFDFGLRESEQLLLACDDAQMEVAARKADAFRAAGSKTREVAHAQVRAQAPELALEVAGGHIVEGAWSLLPERATRAFAEAAREQGAEIWTSTRVFSLTERGGRVSGVACDRGRVPADCVLIATGAWLGELAPRFAVRAARGWVLRTTPLGFKVPWLMQEMSWPDASELGRLGRAPTLEEVAAGSYSAGPRSLLFGQQPGGAALLGASMSPSLKEVPEGPEIPREIASHALQLAPGLRGCGVDAAWSGLRPMSPDGLPIAGAAGTEGLYLLGGLGSAGMMWSPALAAWLAELIVEGRPPAELEPYSPERFLSSGSSTPSA